MTNRLTAAVGPFAIAAAVVGLTLAFRPFALPLPFNETAFQNLGTVFAPLFAMAVFIERAVEVLLTPYRAGHADMLQQKLDNISADPAQKVQADQLREAMAAYRARTQEIAFRLGAGIGMMSSALGVRGVASLLAKEAGAQPSVFVFFDIVLTGLLVGGGADGIHKVVGAVTSFLDGANKRSKSTP